MQKLLLISYHFPHLNVIASQRAAAFATYLPQFGFDVTVVTLDWEVIRPNVHAVRQGTGYTVETHGEATVHRLRSPKTIADSWPSKLGIVQGWTRGEFEGEGGKAYYHLFRDHIRTLLKSAHFDLLLGIFSPHHHLKLCYELNKAFGIPYHLDFRDLWSNRIAMTNYKPSPVEKVQDAFIRKHWTKWLNGAKSFSITSTPWLHQLSALTSTPGIEVRNGFVADEFDEITPVAYDRFTVAYTGSIYLSQQLEIFLEGFATFCQLHPNAQVVFLGSDVASEGGDPTARHTDLHALIAAYLEPHHFSITPRKPRPEALAVMKGADVLLFCAIPELSGWYSGKFLEYLGSNTPILLCPPDEDVLTEAITETGVGLVAHDSEEVVQRLTEFHDGFDLNHRNLMIDQYSRKAQVKKLADFLKLN